MSEQEILDRIQRLEKQLQLLKNPTGLISTPGLLQLYESLYVQGNLNVDGTLTGGTHAHNYLSRYSSSGMAINDLNPIQPDLANQGGGAAALSFQRQGAYGVNFGKDTDNQLKIGGWNMGNVAYRIRHDANQPGMLVYRSTNQALTQSVWNTINWDTWVYQTPAAGIYVRDAGGYLVPEAGWYGYIFTINVGGLTGNTFMSCGLQSGGSWWSTQSYIVGPSYPYLTLSGVTYCAGNRRIEPFVMPSLAGLNATAVQYYGNTLGIIRIY